MSKLENLQPGLLLAGVIPGQNVSVIAVQPHGADAIELTYKTAEGDLGQRVLGRDAEEKLAIAHAEARPLDAIAADFKLVAECQRIKLAGLSDPMLAVTTSDIQPLPHQLRAVYGELLPRTPLRFLLADDPGAGKTIMAGLYLKELILREDVKRCLVVAPGGLVDQWQDELYLKFGLAFEILTPQFGETVFGASAFEQHPLLIARMDQLARNDDLLAELAKSEWDLVIVDEAHRMGAHYFGGKLEKTKRFQLGEQLGDVARHLLLMTATPHSGKEEDFQLFLTLLDRDRFEGKYQAKIHTADTSGVMRRMVKEDLLTFDGKPLFTERIAETIPYELTELEQELYEQVTTYVREGMNRAEKLDGKRRNTVGFALTVLQRRLASSPEAIYRSLERRAARLERRKQEILDGTAVGEPSAADVIGDEEFDDDEFSAEELEHIEDELVDAATAARTVEELDAELLDLRDLVKAAARVRASDTDRSVQHAAGVSEGASRAQQGTSRATEPRDPPELPPRARSPQIVRWGNHPAAHGTRHVQPARDRARPLARRRPGEPHVLPRRRGPLRPRAGVGQGPALRDERLLVPAVPRLPRRAARRVMALAEALPLAVVDAAGTWTAAELEECVELCERADADAARWALGDWLLAKVPVRPVAGRKTGGHRKMRELAVRVGWSTVHLRGVRDTAYSWPPETRVPAARFYIHDRFRDGGPERAAWRRERLLSTDRGPRGRVTEEALRRWRTARQDDVTPTPTATPAPRSMLGTKARPDVPPAVLDLLQRCDRLIENTGILIVSDVLPTECRPSLDSLIAALNGVGEALAQAKLI